MSPKGYKLGYYLRPRGTQFVIPEAVKEEYKRYLIKEAKRRINKVQEELRQLARFFNPVEGWTACEDTVIEARAEELAMGSQYGAIFLEETKEIRKHAERRYSEKRPPGHTKKKDETSGDCRIWEQCLELLLHHDVIFVSQDKDFLDRHEKKLHPQLDAEAKKVGAGRRSLSFYSDMNLLLGELKKEIDPIPDDAIFHFIYEGISKNRRSSTHGGLLAHANPPHDELSHGENALPREGGPIFPGSHDSVSETIEELQSNSKCQPKMTGKITQTWLATEDSDIIEVRLEVKERWESLDGMTSGSFELSGSCRYHLQEERLDNLWADLVQLHITEPDGSVTLVDGGLRIIRMGGGGYSAAPVYPPDPIILE